jgi:hypothetical protein
MRPHYEQKKGSQSPHIVQLPLISPLKSEVMLSM